MPDINRTPRVGYYEEMHTHVCPACHRSYSCLCEKQPTKSELVCRDCETATYNPAVHGGTGEREEA